MTTSSTTLPTTTTTTATTTTTTTGSHDVEQGSRASSSTQGQVVSQKPPGCEAACGEEACVVCSQAIQDCVCPPVITRMLNPPHENLTYVDPKTNRRVTWLRLFPYSGNGTELKRKSSASAAVPKFMMGCQVCMTYGQNPVTQNQLARGLMALNPKTVCTSKLREHNKKEKSDHHDAEDAMKLLHETVAVFCCFLGGCDSLPILPPPSIHA